MTVVGHGLGTEASIELRLISDSGSMRLGSVVSDPAGDMTVSLRLPSDLPTGTYVVEARSEGPVIQAALSVSGEAVPVDGEEGEPGDRDEEDPLLAPLPSGWGAGRNGAGPIGPAPAPGVGGATVALPLAHPALPAVALGLLIVGAALTVAWVRRTRHR